MNSVTKMAKMLRDGTVTARELVLESLSKINQTDDVLNAWTWLDRHNAIFQAEELDKKEQAEIHLELCMGFLSV